MPIIKAYYGSNNQSIAVTAAATVANNGQASSAVVDNTTNLFLDALVTVKVTVGTITAPSYVNVYAVGTSDGGSTYGGGETNMGTDHTVTLTSPPNIKLIGCINCPANTTAYQAVLEVASAFGGIMPDHWCLVIENKTGAALTAATADYQGIQAQTV